MPEQGAGSPIAPASFDNTYARLPERFYARLSPMPAEAPRWIKLNVKLAEKLGLDPEALASPRGAQMLAGNVVAEGSEPLAIAYAGHQFGHFVPQLGDGRANLLGEVVGRDGLRYDIQLKGSGRTPFSRGGDGRAALGPVLREYLVSEAMAALGVPTTRALAAVATGEWVLRETALPGAVLTRVAASHLRVGTFQYFAARGDTDGLRTLAHYAIARHYPEALQAARPYQALLEGVIARQAALVAQWVLLGFVHGVMNTDNMTISGETIDYGPCAFMEAYDAKTVFSSIDLHGRYAYGNQSLAAHWNLTRLAESLLPLLREEQGSEEAGIASATEALDAFQPQFAAARMAGFCRKLGLGSEREGDAALIEDLLSRMADGGADFTLTFRRLSDAASMTEADSGVRSLFSDPSLFDDWVARWRQRLSEEPGFAGGDTLGDGQARAERMRKANPAYIPRNHRVAAAIEAAVGRQDFGPFEELLDLVSRPYEERPGFEDYMEAARLEQRVLQTFCGT